MINYLNSSNKDCYILDSCNDTQRLIEPVEYWVLNLLTIVLEDNGHRYLVLEYPSYSEIESNGRKNDCIWSVPYMAYLLKIEGSQRLDTVGDIKSFYNNGLKRKNKLFKELENYRFYHMGISHFTKVNGRSYIEYKRSPRQPDRWKCYYINEYYITGIDHLGLLNLTDSEGLHAYRYLPIDNRSLFWETDNDIIFMGKKLSSNIASMLNNSWLQLMKYSNSVTSDMLNYPVYGLILRFDIIGFTKIYEKILSEFKTFDYNGKDLSGDFISKLSYVFENRLQQYSIDQYTIEGDGAIAAIPISSMDNLGHSDIVKYLNLITDIQRDISRLLINLDSSIYIRCVLLNGQYMYGKLAGLSSLHKSVTGDIMIKASRMDQCLQSYIKDNSIVQNIYGVSEELYHKLHESEVIDEFKEVAQIDSFRDYPINMHVIQKGENNHEEYKV